MLQIYYEKKKSNVYNNQCELPVTHRENKKKVNSLCIETQI